ncbi:MAG: hypothetical protein Q9164_006873 [Protoblastenia rupestris]
MVDKDSYKSHRLCGSVSESRPASIVPVHRADTLSSLWVLLLYILVPRVRSAVPLVHNGFQEIASNWVEPDSPNSGFANWPDNLSGGIQLVPVHSHNDYVRRVPLFDALAVGCESVEADIWLQDNDLLVGHSEDSLKKERTLRSLYIDPLTRVLEQQNKGRPTAATATGVFDSSPSTSLILLIDMKSDGLAIWSVLSAQLEPLREKGLLTIHNGSALIPGPITVVGTGNTPFDLVLNMTTRDIFFDAPLTSLSLSIYNATNSYYASSSLGAAVGKTWFGRLSSMQLRTVEAQTQSARDVGLKPRYWDTPTWPIGWRNRIWSDLVTHGIGEGGFLNADDVVSASRWDWSWCSVLGVSVC